MTLRIVPRPEYWGLWHHNGIGSGWVSLFKSCRWYGTKEDAENTARILLERWPDENYEVREYK